MQCISKWKKNYFSFGHYDIAQQLIKLVFFWVQLLNFCELLDLTVVLHLIDLEKEFNSLFEGMAIALETRHEQVHCWLF